MGVDNFLKTYDLTDFTLQLRNLCETLSDYFEDFDTSPILTKLLSTKLELEILYKNAKIKKKTILNKAYDVVLNVINYYIEWETLISDLREEGAPYILWQQCL